MNEINFEVSVSELVKPVIEDLFYPSESDEKIEFVDFGCDLSLPIQEKNFKEIIKAKPKDKVEVSVIDEFYAPILNVQDWWTDYETNRMRRFLIVKDILENKLSDLTYIRVGRVEIRAFVIGKDKFDGTIKGIQTLIIES